MLTVFVYLKMQVVACGAPGATHIADYLPGLYLLVGCNADGLAVGVQCLQATSVVELNVVAGAATPAVHSVGHGHGSVCRRQNRRTVGSLDVGTAVVADFPCDRVGAVAEWRGNTAVHRARPIRRKDRQDVLPADVVYIVVGLDLLAVVRYSG